MQKPILSIICAVSENRAIGKNNQLLWHIPEDMAHFKKLTIGHAIIMGRKTFESIGKPLPNRTNVVITSDPDYSAEGTIVAHTIEEAIEKVKEIEKEEIFIIGGGKIYEQTIDLCDKLYLTVVEGKFEADTFFPDYSKFSVVSEKRGADEKYKYKFLELTR